MLDKTFNPEEVERRIYAQWQASGAFRAGRKPDAEPFCIVIPPPNVTGRLHIGHALNNTLQDMLARFERMRGKDVLWQPGTDHAGIATQLVVERQLAERQQSRVGHGPREIPRRGVEVEGRIRRRHRASSCAGWALPRIGRANASPWTRGFRAPSSKVFVELYTARGLIYKDKRLVNWDPRLQTAVSDLEVENIEIKGNLWHIKYPHRRTMPTSSSPWPRRGPKPCWAIPPWPCIRTMSATRRWSASTVAPAADRAADPDHRRRIFRSRKRHRRGQDHARPRFQRFRSRQAPQAAADQHPQQGRAR